MKSRRDEDPITTADVANAANREPKMAEEPRRREDEPRPKAADYEGNFRQRTRERKERPAQPPTDRRHELDDESGPLFPEQEVHELRSRWDTIQAGFVDEPRQALEKADELVADTVMRLAQSFAEARANLEAQWDRGEEVSTEDLRQTLRRYRAFYGRLLSV